MNKTLLLVAVLSLFGANASAQQYFTKTTPGKYIYKVVDYSPALVTMLQKWPKNAQKVLPITKAIWLHWVHLVAR